MANKKKICFVVASPFTANVFLLKHFEYLSKYYDLYLVANFEEEKSKFTFNDIKECKNINIQRGISIVEDFKSVLKLKSYFKQHNFDAVHSVTPKAGLTCMLASKMANIKIRIHIFTGQVWHTKKGIFKIILKSIDKLIVCCATDILVDGESQRKFLIKNKIVSEDKSLVLGKGSISGVDVNKFIPNQELSQNYRKGLNINNEVVFLFLGRLNFDKGILDLVLAFDKLNQIYSNVRLVIVGPDEESMIEKINSITSNENIILYGSTNKPQEVLQMADVFCLPSYREGFGTSVIEASLLEKPVICSDTYGLMETIIDKETGLRHEVANVNSIFEQMKILINEDLRKNLGKNGRQYVLSNFSADTISEKWLEYYKAKMN
jgi:glycosyltransferase involved in cell wall biosynthesis